MTRRTEDVPRLPRTDGPANAPEAEGHRYLADAVQREIAKDRRIKPKEVRLIHALRQGVTVRLNSHWRSRTFHGKKLFECRRATSHHRRQGTRS